jgi:hypothetical protein
MRVGHLPATVATVDLLVAVHRGRAHSSRQWVLHPVHRNEPLHHVRDSYCSVLRPRDSDVHSVLAYLEGDGEAAEGPAKPAGWQEGQQQTVQLQVVSTLPNNNNLCRTEPTSCERGAAPVATTSTKTHRMTHWHWMYYCHVLVTRHGAGIDNRIYLTLITRNYKKL